MLSGPTSSQNGPLKTHRLRQASTAPSPKRSNRQLVAQKMDPTATEAKPNVVIVRHEDAQAFAEAVLEANGVSKTNATIIARGLVQADLRGVDSHGINRLPSYIARVRNGVLDPKAEPTLTQVTPVVALVSRFADTGYKHHHVPISHLLT